jgi:hypothetical protein
MRMLCGFMVKVREALRNWHIGIRLKTCQVGSGKSILWYVLEDETYSSITNQESSLVIKYLQDSPATSRDILWIPIIFSFDGDYQYSPDFVYRTCLACLCALDPMPIEIKTAFETNLNAVQIKDIEALLINALKEVATSIREQNTKPLDIVAVVDAVDETASSQQQTFLRHLNRLIGSNTQSRLVRFRSILFSRDTQTVSHFCGPRQGWRKEEIPPLALRGDILTAVSSRLEDDYNFQTWSTDDREDLAAQIANRANGMYVGDIGLPVHYKLTHLGSVWPPYTLNT